MAKSDFYYPSCDGKTQIHGIRWQPEGEPKAVVQIIHGMIEFVGRYSEFASFLNDHGYLVVGEDHLGHGESVVSDEDHGYFGKNGNQMVIDDIHALRMKTQAEYPNIPYIMMGHSMGSFLVRQYITEKNAAYAYDLAGVIIMGTGWNPPASLAAGKALAKLTSLFKGDRAKSRTMEVIAFGPYLKRIEHPKTVNDWLTRDDEVVKWYRNEPWCTFHFSVNGFYEMFKGIEISQDTKRMKRLPAGLPLLLIAGAEDPVGQYGEGVRKAFVKYKDNTECQVDIKLYDDDRHEILNEFNKEEVYSDLLEWLDACVEDRK